MRVLIVDDDAGNREYFRRALEKLGHTVVLAGDGVEGLHEYRLSEEDFGFVLSDLQMPRMSGVEMVRCILGLSPKQHIAIMSAESDLVIRQLRQKNLDVMVFQKPLSTGEIVSHLKDIGLHENS